MQIHFHGATQTVTGSLHEIRFNSSVNKTILLDAGLFQGPRALARQINSSFQFDPKSVHAVILSHAHQDHCGNLPNLVKQGFSGPIYCTRATAAIAALMIMDSAKIQEEDAAYLNQKTVKSWKHNGNGTIQPLYTREDAEKAIALFKPLDYKQPLTLFTGNGASTVTAELHDAGHTLGSAAVRLTESSNGSGGPKPSSSPATSAAPTPPSSTTPTPSPTPTHSSPNAPTAEKPTPPSHRSPSNSPPSSTKPPAATASS